MDKDVSDIDYGNLSAPIASPGKDELAHLAKEVDNARIRLLEAQKTEKKTNDAQKYFVRGLAHDLRTPMTALLTYITLANQTHSPEKAQTYLASAYAKTQTLNDMINEMFEYLSLETRKTVDLSDPELLVSAFGDTLSEFIFFLAEYGFSPDTGDLSFPWETVSVNPTYVNRIFSNLFSNIEKYAASASTVKITLQCRNGEVVISVSNRIAYKETANHGSKLGLKNVGEMMRLMHGRVETDQDFEKMLFTVKLIFPLISIH